MGICFTKPRLIGLEHSETKNTPIVIERKKGHRLSVALLPERDISEPLNEIILNHSKSIRSEKPDAEEESRGLLVLNSRTIIEGMQSTRIQKGFEDKKMNIDGDFAKIEAIQSMGIGFACKKGLKPHAPNQDDFAIVLDANFKFFGVFDGHGTDGHEVSNYIHSRLPTTLMTHPSFESDILTAFTESFLQTNTNLKDLCESENAKFESTLSGSTATTVLLRGTHIYIGHVGDSRAIMGIKRANTFEAVRLTLDHKPMLPEEKERIESRNGEVKKLPDDIPHRIFVKGKDYPGLSTSRAIGDFLAQEVGVISTPQVCDIELTEESTYLIMCSDGVWEFINDQEAVDTVSKSGTNAKQAAERLASLAWGKWIQYEEDVVDDITVIVAYLPNLVKF
ncbi:unnamed protein product [Blepharisma stoltei]|uniref:PPM-type phosphatase domain-containing protein n=1 Tax=Blepharisma stoltei TaxID=1481888 RepID=A0AAU9JJP0_9CILI|nr:unnamed protein product [Blepharisma stoltei]